ncbi:MAG: hypothetical protein ACU841_08630 [Gammaproteobacteria bacterium]
MAHTQGKEMMPGMSMPGGTMGKKVVQGGVASAAARKGGKLMSTVGKHPVLVFGLGAVAGVLIYKYRKQIIAGANKVVDSGKDFILQQKENLEDIVAETKEES